MQPNAWWIMAVVTWLGAPPAAIGAPAGADLAASLDSLVRETLAVGMNPGVSVAVVRGGEILWARGFGEADRERHRPVTAASRFYIASTTKALTALAVAQLAATGTLDLDAPYSRLVPGARLPAGVAAESVTVRTLLTHTHGISSDGPISTVVAYTGDYTEAQLLRVLESHQPAPNGRAFRYSNLGYDLAAIAMSGGKPRGWCEVVERTVTAPLGMTATTAYRSRVPDSLLALPYDLGGDGLERIRLGKQDANMGPAGGHFSTATDLARLLIAELNRGRVDGRQAIPAAVIAETQRLQATQNRDFTFFHRYGWGLGWDLGTYDRDTLLHRFGGFPGYRSHVSFMPARGLGVVVLSNGGTAGSLLADLVAVAIYDRLLERPDGPSLQARRLDEARERFERGHARLAEERARRAARPQTLRHPLEAYTGTYAHPDWGTLVLTVEDGHLAASMGVARSAVEVLDADKEQLRVELFGDGETLAVTFADGAPRATEVRLGDVTFRRR